MDKWYHISLLILSIKSCAEEGFLMKQIEEYESGKSSLKAP
jgi:hypothetical protein